jgi:type I restriction enzyme S subunit
VTAEWCSTTIDAACNIEYGTRVVQKRDGGSVFPVYGGGGATFFMDTANRESRVVVSRFGMSEECTRFVDGMFFLNDSGLTLSPKDLESLLPTFLDRLILSLNREIFSLGRGAAQKNLDVPAFKALRISYPSSIADQRRIVAILDEAFEGIATAKAHAERNLRNAREVFESRLHTFFDDEASERWPRRTLREVALDFGRGKSKHRPRNDPVLYGGPYPFIQTGDVRGSDHIITEYTQTYSEAGLAQSKLWPKGTLCITIAANIAETGVLGFDACFPDSVIGVVVDEEKTSSKYIEYMLGTFKAALKAKGKGSAQDNINLGTFENERFPFPDLETQSRIVQTLDGLSAEVIRVEDLYQRKLAALDDLKQSLLHQAFSGAL